MLKRNLITLIIIATALIATPCYAQTVLSIPESGKSHAEGSYPQAKYVAISGATSGNNTLVAAVSGKKIRVLHMLVIAASAVDIRIEDGANGAGSNGSLTGVMSVAANAGFNTGFNQHGLFETSSGTLLNMELGGAVQVSGFLVYILV